MKRLYFGFLAFLPRISFSHFSTCIARAVYVFRYDIDVRFGVCVRCVYVSENVQIIQDISLYMRAEIAQL